MSEERQDDEIVIGLVSVSDRASRGEYEDKGIPALRDWCGKAIRTPVRFVERLIPDDRYTIEKTLVSLVDDERCGLVLTTGGTGPSRRDVTPEATLAVATRELPGFGEQMRAISLNFVPTAILSRQVGALREIPGHAALIVNLPGQPKSIVETLGGVKREDGSVAVPGIFAAIPYCIDLIGGPYMETDPAFSKAFRPKSALAARAAALAAREESEKKDQPESPTETHEAPETQAAPKAPEAPGATEAPRSAEAEKPQAEPSQKAKPYVDPDPVRVPRETSAVISPAGQPLEVFTASAADKSLPPPCAVVWLSSMGLEVEAFSELPEQVWHMGGPAARFYMVNAPKIELAAAPGRRLRAWFDESVPGAQEDAGRIRENAARITRLVNRIASQGIPRKRIFLAGFEQGASLALFTGLRQELALGGIIAFAGRLPLASTLPAEITDGGRATPVLMGHGAYDEILPLPLAERSARLIRNFAPIVWREYEEEHGFGELQVKDMADFLSQILEH